MKGQSTINTTATQQTDDRSASTLAKVDRVRKALRHQEPDRVPISDFFWGAFVRRWRKELDLPDDATPHLYYDLDWRMVNPNMDPHIKSFETIKEDAEEVVIKAGFESTLCKRFSLSMPELVSHDTDTIEKLEAFEFDDPRDSRRFFSAGDNQIAGVGDSFTRNSPPWIETIRSWRRNFAMFGAMMEASECLTRLVGQMNTFLWIGEEPERFGKQILRIGEFYYQCLEAEIEAACGLLDGIIIWGDMAYRNSMFFSPDYWRAYFKPCVKAMIELCHRHDLPVIYHGDGNVRAVLPDFIEMGLDAFNPLEVNAGFDVCDLRREFGHKLGFCGNGDKKIWEEGDPDKVRRDVMHKLNAAKGGGMLFQSDHTVSSNVSGKTYDTIVKLVREYGRYPIQLGEFDEPMS